MTIVCLSVFVWCFCLGSVIFIVCLSVFVWRHYLTSEGSVMASLPYIWGERHLYCVSQCFCLASLHYIWGERHLYCVSQCFCLASLPYIWGERHLYMFYIQINPLGAEIFSYKPWRTEDFVQFKIIINVLVSSFWFIWIPMLWVYGHYI